MVTPLQLTGRVSRAQLTGAVSMDRGVIYIPDVLTQKNVVSLDDPEFFNVVDTSLFQNRLAPARGAAPAAAGSDAHRRPGHALGNGSVAQVLGDQRQSLDQPRAADRHDGADGARLDQGPGARRVPWSPSGATIASTWGSSACERSRWSARRHRPLHGVTSTSTRTSTSPASTPCGSLRTNAGNIDSPISGSESCWAGRSNVRLVALSSADSALQLLAIRPAQLSRHGAAVVRRWGTARMRGTVGSVFLPTIGTALGSRLSGGIFDYVNVQGRRRPTPATARPAGSARALSTTRIGAGKAARALDLHQRHDLGVCGLGATGAAGRARRRRRRHRRSVVRLGQQLTQRLTLAASSEPGTVGLYCTTGALTRKVSSIHPGSGAWTYFVQLAVLEWRA